MTQTHSDVGDKQLAALRDSIAGGIATRSSLLRLAASSAQSGGDVGAGGNAAHTGSGCLGRVLLPFDLGTLTLNALRFSTVGALKRGVWEALEAKRLLLGLQPFPYTRGETAEQRARRDQRHERLTDKAAAAAAAASSMMANPAKDDAYSGFSDAFQLWLEPSHVRLRDDMPLADVHGVKTSTFVVCLARRRAARAWLDGDDDNGKGKSGAIDESEEYASENDDDGDDDGDIDAVDGGMIGNDGSADEPLQHARATILHRLYTLQDTQRGSTVLIEGDAGVGKTRLLSSTFSDHITHIYCVECAPYTMHRPLYAWRSLVLRIIRANTGLTEAESKDFVRKYLPKASTSALDHMFEFLDTRKTCASNDEGDDYDDDLLKGTVTFGDGQVDTAEAAAATREVKMDETRQSALYGMCLELIAAYSRDNFLILVIDNALYMDALSWRACHEITQSFSSPPTKSSSSWQVLLLIATRPFDRVHMQPFNNGRWCECSCDVHSCSLLSCSLGGASALV
jgi:hypothetical protein